MPTPYPSYKDPGLTWLPRVPKDWEVTRIKTRVHLVTEKAEEKTYPVALEHIESGSGRMLLTDATFDADGIKFQKGDVLFGKLRPYLAKSWLADRQGEAVGDFLVLRPRGDVHPHYFHYVTLSPEFIRTVNGSTFGSKMPRASWDFVGNMPCPFPDLDTQRRITAFLARETSRIDTLITKHERLVKLLAEKRQAIITQAVTKGLDPSAPTKPSSIPWVPASPIHWAASRIKWTHPKQESGTSVNGTDVPADSGHIGVLKTGAVSKGYFLASSNKTVVPEDVDRATCPVRGGTLIVNRANTPDLVGSTGAPETDMPTLFLSDKLWQIDFKDANTRFMYWWTKTDGYRSQIQFRRVGASSSMQNLSYSDFLTIDLAVPPLSEQEKIAQYLDGRTKQLDVLAFKARQAIALLRERRSALISAAVTGKIDVRELVA